VDLAKGHGIPVMMHSCGSSSWAFGDFVEMGISVVDTLQPDAHAMAPTYLKREWGDRLAFHGCISTGGVLVNGTVAEVEAMVRETMETMKPGGGYAFAPTHMLQDNTPTGNAVALYAAARRYGGY
jgi:uroporphyrinogen-III decarboxylase